MKSSGIQFAFYNSVGTASGTPVTDGSIIEWDETSLDNIAGFYVNIDGSDVDVGYPAYFGENPTTFAITVGIDITLSNGQHTLIIKAYDSSFATGSPSATLIVVKS